MRCIYCNNPNTYLLSNAQRKCSQCRRKFSPKKIDREQQLLALFTQGVNAHNASQQTQMHVATVQKYFDTFRKNVALESDASYQANTERINGYDEYLYLPKSLKADRNIEKIQHFLTLSYDDKVYNLMMPSIRRLGFDSSDTDAYRLLEKYLAYHRVSKLSKERSTIRDFWNYFESFIVRFKGISEERFVFYLKEAEWRFNTKQFGLES